MYYLELTFELSCFKFSSWIKISLWYNWSCKFFFKRLPPSCHLHVCPNCNFHILRSWQNIMILNLPSSIIDSLPACDVNVIIGYFNVPLIYDGTFVKKMVKKTILIYCATLFFLATSCQLMPIKTKVFTNPT